MVISLVFQNGGQNGIDGGEAGQPRSTRNDFPLRPALGKFSANIQNGGQNGIDGSENCSCAAFVFAIFIARPNAK